MHYIKYTTKDGRAFYKVTTKDGHAFYLTAAVIFQTSFHHAQ